MNAAQPWSSDEFERHAAAGPVLVVFSAEWSSQCLAQKGALTTLQAVLEGRAELGCVDVDRTPGLAEQYRVRSIPTLLLLKEGAECLRLVGLQAPGTVEAALAGVL